MDRQPTVMDAARRIRDSIGGYARSKGWRPQQYRILMDYHSQWGAITLVLFSEEFRRINPDSDKIQDEMRFYDEIMDKLENDFEDSPEIYEAIGLLLRPFDEYYTWGYRGSIEGIIEIEDRFLNPEVGPGELRGAVGIKL